MGNGWQLASTSHRCRVELSILAFPPCRWGLLWVRERIATLTCIRPGMAAIRGRRLVPFKNHGAGRPQGMRAESGGLGTHPLWSPSSAWFPISPGCVEILYSELLTIIHCQCYHWAHTRESIIDLQDKFMKFRISNFVY